MSDDLNATLCARKATHGDFTDHAAITQALKDVARRGVSWHALSPVQREAVEMILHKLGRVLSGNPSHTDHWFDIAGYARLVEERIP